MLQNPWMNGSAFLVVVVEKRIVSHTGHMVHMRVKVKSLGIKT
jgi:hypothetical protein